MRTRCGRATLCRMNTIPPFDAELLRRYDKPGPRYTSYPTAPQFSARFGEAQFRDHARLSNQDPIPRQLSLYLHIPYCFSPCFYCGCHRIITHDVGRSGPYLERLLREAEEVSRLFDRDREVIQLHLGGGTPKLPDQRSAARDCDRAQRTVRPGHSERRELRLRDAADEPTQRR